MTHHIDRVKTFAIDHFPDMNDKDIEKYHIKNMDKKRIKSEELFRRLELEDISKNHLHENYTYDEDISIHDLLVQYENNSTRDLRYENSKDIRPQLTDLMLVEEIVVAEYSLGMWVCVGLCVCLCMCVHVCMCVCIYDICVCMYTCMKVICVVYLYEYIFSLDECDYCLLHL